MIEPDAERPANVVQIKVCQARNLKPMDSAFMGKGSPHVGFPEAVLGKYAEKLVSLGYKVRRPRCAERRVPS